jgi:hypothetical protein
MLISKERATAKYGPPLTRATLARPGCYFKSDSEPGRVAPEAGRHGPQENCKVVAGMVPMPSALSNGGVFSVISYGTGTVPTTLQFSWTRPGSELNAAHFEW